MKYLEIVDEIIAGAKKIEESEFSTGSRALDMAVAIWDIAHNERKPSDCFELKEE